MTLTLAEGHKVSSVEQNLLGFIFLHMKFDVFKGRSWCNFLKRCAESREIIAALLTTYKNSNIGMHFDVNEPIGFKLGVMINNLKLCILKLV